MSESEKCRKIETQSYIMKERGEVDKREERKTERGEDGAGGERMKHRVEGSELQGSM